VSVSTVNVCVSGSVSVIATVTANALCVDSYCNLSVGTGINDAHLGELLQMMELSYLHSFCRAAPCKCEAQDAEGSDTCSIDPISGTPLWTGPSPSLRARNSASLCPASSIIGPNSLYHLSCSLSLSHPPSLPLHKLMVWLTR
jgi:hypothetical protein